MMERFLAHADSIIPVLAADKRTQLKLNWSDVDVLNAVFKGLKPVGDFTDVLSAENYVTSSALLPMLKLCRDDTLKEKVGDVDLTKAIKQGILTKLEAKYGLQVREFARKCTFLDPRYRGCYESSNAALEDTKHHLTIEMVSLERQAEGEKQQDNAARAATAGEDTGVRDRPGEADEAAEPAHVPPPPPKKAKPTLASLLQQVADHGGPVFASTVEERAAEELIKYGQEKVINGDNDPLMWWKSYGQSNYPMMSRLARKYLCACATSVPSERVFSTAGNVVTPLRSLLKPEKVNMLVFLAKNA